jgi:flagellar biosynthesis protein FliQ
LEGRQVVTSDFVVGLMAEAIKVTMLISAPVLIVGLVVGVVISLIQAVTQIQEMTLVFVPKIVAVLVVLVAALPWMMNIMITYTHNLITSIPMSIK